MSDPIGTFWEQARAAVPALAGVTRYKVRGFGRQEQLSRMVLNVIRNGEKTGTFAVDWEFDAQPGQRPVPGDHYIVVDHADVPEMVIRITATEIVPYNEIGQRHVDHEGKVMRDLEAWRKLHWPYWTAVLGALGREPAEDMPILFQEFVRVYPA